MPIKRTPDPMRARWKNRRVVGDDFPDGIPVPVIWVTEGKELPGNELVSVLRELGPRQWQATSQLLLEAKYKAEAMLRDPATIASPTQTAYYVGWVAYADFVLGSFESLRAGNLEGKAEE